MGFLGRRSPVAERMAYGLPVMRCSVPRSRPAAWTLMRTSWSPGSGMGTSPTCRTSDVPYLSWMTAFMVAPCAEVVVLFMVFLPFVGWVGPLTYVSGGGGRWW